MSNNAPDSFLSVAASSRLRLLDLVRDRLRTLHYSIRTESAYTGWIRRFIVFRGRRHPAEMGKFEVEAFLTHLAVARNVSAATQNQALSAILFLYKEVLASPLPRLDDVTWAKKPTRLPTVLDVGETSRLIAQVDDPEMMLVVGVLYGAGLRLLEASRLRVKDVDLPRRELVIRDGKGGPASSSRCRRTPCATSSPPTCSKAATTSVRFRSCSATAT